MTGKLISISGIDGSGKTTLSKEVVKALRELGINCKYAYGKLDPKFTYFLIKLGRKLFLQDKDPRKNYNEYLKAKRNEIRKRKLLAKIYYGLLLFEYKISIFLKIWIHLKLGKLIVCDRYVFDTIISDLALDLGYSEDKIISEIQRMFKRLPKPDLAFLIDLPEDVALARKNDIWSEEYLKERRNLYLRIAEKFNMEVLDGTKNLEETKQHALKRIRGVYE